MIKRKSLILLTQKFPFESGEEFLATELPYLEKAFEKIVIVPTAVRDFSSRRIVGENVTVLEVPNPKGILQIALKLVKNFGFTATSLLSEVSKSQRNIHLLKYYLYHIPYARQIRTILSELCQELKDPILYSYWMDTNAFAASLLKKRNPSLKLFVKSHGGDLYNERNKAGVIAFRESVYKEADGLFFISKHGYEYASSFYPDYSDKMAVFRLGTKDKGISPLPSSNTSFMMVSCSSLVALKRVELIAEVLNQVNLPITWIHFGGDRVAIRQLKTKLPKLRKGFEIYWKGKVPNEEIQSFYKENAVDLFINLSSSEGIPVSMMEAISFGIPIFSNDVGGISEIVNDQTGMLISEGKKSEEIADLLSEFLKGNKTKDKDFRDGVKKYWNQNYSASQNHPKLIHELIKESLQ